MLNHKRTCCGTANLEDKNGIAQIECNAKSLNLILKTNQKNYYCLTLAANFTPNIGPGPQPEYNFGGHFIKVQTLNSTSGYFEF